MSTEEQWVSECLRFISRSNAFVLPGNCVVCLKGNGCITFPAGGLELASTRLILEHHMVPEMGK